MNINVYVYEIYILYHGCWHLSFRKHFCDGIMRIATESIIIIPKWNDGIMRIARKTLELKSIK